MGETIPPHEELFFDANAKLDEQKRSNRELELSFSLVIATKPNVAKYSASGTVTLEGDMKDIAKKLETNPKTNIPQILFTVYQHIFSSIYLLSAVLKTPYPPPDLLHPMQEKIQIIAQGSGTQTSERQLDKSSEPLEAVIDSEALTRTTGDPNAANEKPIVQTQAQDAGDEGKAEQSVA